VVAWWFVAAASFQPFEATSVRSGPGPYSARATQSITGRR
jgi:hypothetical protein